MLKRHRLVAAIAAVAGSVTLALTGLSAASASPARSAASGTEHFQFVVLHNVGFTPVIMHGVVLASGTDYEGNNTDVLKFPGGSFKLNHVETSGSEPLNPKTCLGQTVNIGTYKITGGTGKFKGISGHGTYHFTELIITKKVNGICRTDLPFKAFQQIIYASGPMSL
jgi:hypothetical protein